MTLKIEAGKYYRTRDGRKVGPMIDQPTSRWPWEVDTGEGDLCRMLWKDDGTADETQDADLIAEWHDHIITYAGRHYDLTAMEAPFGLLPEPVRGALKAWPHGVYLYNGEEWKSRSRPLWSAISTYRAKPAPIQERVPCFRGGSTVRAEFGTCIKRADGSIDWTTWEPGA